MKWRLVIGVVGLVGLTVVLLFLLGVVVCEDMAFIDRNTGSRKGYREWMGGGRTGEWYQESGVEAFMRKQHAGELRQDWANYAGTGRNILGRYIESSHGSPGEIMGLPMWAIEEYCQQASEAEKRHVYEVLSSGDKKEIRKMVDEMCEIALRRLAEKD